MILIVVNRRRFNSQSRWIVRVHCFKNVRMLSYCSTSTQDQTYQLVKDIQFDCNFSSKNCFVAGSKAGHVAILTESTVEKSIKLFDNSVQWKNATLVQYVNNTIYAVAQDSKLTKLNLTLENRQVLGDTVSHEVFALTATNLFVALGGVSAKVTVYDTEGNITLVRTTFTVKFNVQDITKLVDCSCCTIFSTFLQSVSISRFIIMTIESIQSVLTETELRVGLWTKRARFGQYLRRKNYTLLSTMVQS